MKQYKTKVMMSLATSQGTLCAEGKWKQGDRVHARSAITALTGMNSKPPSHISETVDQFGRVTSRFVWEYENSTGRCTDVVVCKEL